MKSSLESSASLSGQRSHVIPVIHTASIHGALFVLRARSLCRFLLLTLPRQRKIISDKHIAFDYMLKRGYCGLILNI